MQSLILGLVMIVAAPAPKEAESTGILGDWLIEAEIFLGKSLKKDGKDPAGTMSFTKDGQVSWGIAKDKPDGLKFTHDEKASTISVEIDPSKVMQGIYKLEKDKLTICLGIKRDRPKSIEERDNTWIFILKRTKKD